VQARVRADRHVPRVVGREVVRDHGDGRGEQRALALVPGRLEDALLQTRTVEAAERERVRGEGGEPESVESAAQTVAPLRRPVLRERERDLRRQVEPDAEHAVGRDALAHRGAGLLERPLERDEVLAGEDVQAVAEGDAAARVVVVDEVHADSSLAGPFGARAALLDGGCLVDERGPSERSDARAAPVLQAVGSTAIPSSTSSTGMRSRIG